MHLFRVERLIEIFLVVSANCHKFERNIFLGNCECLRRHNNNATISTTSSQFVEELDRITYGNCTSKQIAAENKVRSSVSSKPVELYLRNKNGSKVELNVGKLEDWSNYFIPDATLVILVHGFISDNDSEFGQKLQKALLQTKENVNLILVSWRKLAYIETETRLCYFTAITVQKHVGKIIADLVTTLVHNNISSFERVHYVGHSLGAHLANFVAGEIEAGRKIGRITALDPPIPLYPERKLDILDTTDAEFVEVIHTQPGDCMTMGHFDFYPNGGKIQPGCGTDLCDHNRAYELYIDSILFPESLVAVACLDYESFDNGECSSSEKTVMGWVPVTTTRGKYMLRTNDKSPYGMGLDGTQPERRSWPRVKTWMRTNLTGILISAAITFILIGVCYGRLAPEKYLE